MTDPLKKLGDVGKKSVKAAAQQAAKTLKEEREEFVKTAKKQVVGEKKPSQPPIMTEVIPNGQLAKQKPVLEEEEKKVKATGIAQLEADLEELRRESQQQEQRWREEQEEKMQAEEAPAEEVIAPPPSPKKGPVGPLGKKKTRGTGEMIKSRR